MNYGNGFKLVAQRDIHKRDIIQLCESLSVLGCTFEPEPILEGGIVYKTTYDYPVSVNGL